LASKLFSPHPARGGEEPVIAKGPFLIFLFMMPAFLLIIGLLLLAMQYKQLRAFVADQPMQMVEIPQSPQAESQVLAKVRGFFSDTVSDTLALSAAEVNHLSRTSRSLAEQRLDYHFGLQDTLIIARNSLPADRLNGILATLARVLGIKGYLNSEMKAYPELKDGKITLVPRGAVMNGIPAPVSVLEKKGPVDLRSWVADTGFYDEALRSLSGIQVRGDSLLLIKKPGA
jgi:hypothetical protein